MPLKNLYQVLFNRYIFIHFKSTMFMQFRTRENSPLFALPSIIPKTKQRTHVNDIRKMMNSLKLIIKMILIKSCYMGMNTTYIVTSIMILLSTIKFCLDSKRFDLPLF